MEAGDSAKALSHHTELHRNLRAPAKKNAAPVNSQQAATPVPALTYAPQISTAVQAAPPVWSYAAPTWPTPVPKQMNTSYFPTAQPLPVLSQPSPTTQPAPAKPTIPHHTIGAGNFSGFSNQVVRYTGQPQQSQQISCEENQYFQDVFSVDPGLLSIYAANPKDLNLFRPWHYFQSIFTGVVNLNHSMDVEVTALSDDGACLNFGRAGLFKEHGITSVGNWSGKIKTLNKNIRLTNAIL